MTTTHLLVRALHIAMGSVAILSGAAALVLRKGARPHARVGTLFFGSMLAMAASGLVLATVFSPNRGNVMGGSFTLYLVTTAWAAAWRPPRTVGRLEVGLALLGLTVAAAGLGFGAMALRSPTGRLDLFPAPIFFVFGGFALLATLFDVRMLARGGYAGAPRTARHLVRMCGAMFIATGSFFLGQAKLFPPAVRASGVLRIPVYLVIAALLYGFVRIRLWPALRRAWHARVPILPSAR